MDSFAMVLIPKPEARSHRCSSRRRSPITSKATSALTPPPLTRTTSTSPARLHRHLGAVREDKLKNLERRPPSQAQIRHPPPSLTSLRRGPNQFATAPTRPEIADLDLGREEYQIWVFSQRLWKFVLLDLSCDLWSACLFCRSIQVGKLIRSLFPLIPTQVPEDAPTVRSNAPEEGSWTDEHVDYPLWISCYVIYLKLIYGHVTNVVSDVYATHNLV